MSSEYDCRICEKRVDIDFIKDKERYWLMDDDGNMRGIVHVACLRKAKEER